MIADWMVDPNFEGPFYAVLESDSDGSAKDEETLGEETYTDESVVSVIPQPTKPGIFKRFRNLFKRKKTMAKSQTLISIISDEFATMVDNIEATAESAEPENDRKKDHNEQRFGNSTVVDQKSTGEVFPTIVSQPDVYSLAENVSRLTVDRSMSSSSSSYTPRPVRCMKCSMGRVLPSCLIAPVVVGFRLAPSTSASPPTSKISTVERASTADTHVRFQEEWDMLVQEGQKSSPPKSEVEKERF